MILMKWLFLLLVIPTIEASPKLWKPKTFSLEGRVTKKILETCYGDNDFKDLIFILGDFNELFDKVSVIRMNNLLDVDEYYESRQYSSIGVTKVLMIEESPETLHSDLISFNKTRWWNHMLPFFIIGKNDEKCENFEEILDTTWRMDILNSIYICSQSENTTLYTLNPITNYAPNPWKRTDHFHDLNIYHQVFDSHTSCNNLNYDKTKVLNGYPITAIAPPFTKNWSMEKRMIKIRTLPSSCLFIFITSQLNASVMYKSIIDNDQLLYLEKNYGDLTYLPFRTSKIGRLLCLFPIEERSQHIVLVRSNERTVLHKIGHLWSRQVLYVAAIALIILFSILVMKNNDMSSAMLDILRFLTYGSIQTDTRSHSLRIYFTAMLIFIVISNGVFQGKIAAFLTKSDKVPPIKTVEELEDSEYNFYIVDGRSLEMLSWIFPLNIKSADSTDACIDYVLHGTLNACIIPLSFYEEKHLLKSLDRVIPSAEYIHSNRWLTRRNWPLYERFNYMLMRFIESGILVHEENTKVSKIKDNLKAYEDELALAEIVTPYQPIELVELNFAFKLLAIGLSFATFVLIVELRIREIGISRDCS